MTDSQNIFWNKIPKPNRKNFITFNISIYGKKVSSKYGLSAAQNMVSLLFDFLFIHKEDKLFKMMYFLIYIKDYV